MPKHSLRLNLLEMRRRLSQEEQSLASAQIQKTFLATPEFAAAKCLALYSPVQGEVGTSEVLRVSLDSGKSIMLPVVCGDKMFFRLYDPLSELKKGAYGILEPEAAAPTCNPQTADVVVVPGIAFDVEGKRIGFGKGYYDRVFHVLEGSGRLVGFCYDFQLVEKIAAEPHDVCMDMVISEQRVIRVRG